MMPRLLHLLPFLLALVTVFPTWASPAAQTTDCNSATGIPVIECQALMALYTNTNGPSWTDKIGWGVTNTPCNWYGVTCEGGQVVGLGLNDNHLVGTIPPEIGSLPALEFLWLFYNELTGSIPPEVGNLTHLREFELGINQLTGIIPGSVGNFTNVMRFGLSYNHLSGTIPPEIGRLSQAVVIQLNNNQLSGSIPSEIGYLSHLQELRLENNQLSGVIPASLVNLSPLVFADFGYNRLTTSNPALLALLAAISPYWATTQTVPPTNVRFSTGLTLSWTPIGYTGDGGYYVISYSTAPNEPYTVAGQTADKNVSSYTITEPNFAYDTTYYFVVQSYTPVHGDQQNNLMSSYSMYSTIKTEVESAYPKRGYYTTRTPTLTWNPVSSAWRYEVQVAESSGFLPGEFVYVNPVVPAGTLSAMTFSLDDGVYYWRVRAIGSNRSAGAWSAVDSFVVDAP